MAMIVDKKIQGDNSWPIPLDLAKNLPYPKTPWLISEGLFKRVQNEPLDTTNQFRCCKILSSDPECEFVLKYFYQQKPPKYGIKNIYCIHNAAHTQAFEGAVKNVEQEAQNLFFSPQWDKEKNADQRKEVIERWKKLTDQFSPIEIKGLKRTDTITKAKIIFLWHGCDENAAKSVSSSGFTFFGKHHFFNPLASSGGSKSTDQGYFGSGIYFTDSAKYAGMYAKGRLMMGIVLMREPFPVVSNVKHPNKCDDMKVLEGQGAYQKYNSHFIPVASIRPKDSKCMEYYPCEKGQEPAWDEFVVFQSNHTLARFEVELCDDSPGSMPALYSFDACVAECKKGNIELVKQWLMQDPSRLKEKDQNNKTLFDHAFENDQLEILDWMKVLSKNEFQKFISESKKLMYLAAERGSVDTMKWLFEKDRDVLNKYKTPMFHFTWFRKELELDKNKPIWDTESPMHAAVRKNQSKAVVWLCSKRPYLAIIESFSGILPKALTKNQEIISALLNAEKEVKRLKEIEEH